MMNAGDIAFPHLGIYLENVPRSFSVFGFEIAFYGLIIGIGVLAGILMAVHQAKVTGENPDTIWDFAIYAVIFSVIGARIYYVVFAWDYYKDNLLSIFNTRNVEAGECVGEISYLVDGRVWRRERLIAAKDVEAIDLLWCGRQILLRFLVRSPMKK